MKQAVQDFIDSRRIAVVGVSRSGKKFGNSVYTELKDRGYQMFIVHPEAQEINGEPAYPNLAALQGKVDAVVINVPSRHTAQLVREAVAAGIKHIWIQQGAESLEADKVARELGVTPVSGKCILMYAPPVKSFHGWHRAINRIFGKL